MPALAPFSAVLATDPAALMMQMGVLGGGAVLLFLLFWTLRDALLRSRSLVFQVFSLFLVTALPLFGFLAYLLIRPAQTLQEREQTRLLHAVLRELQHGRGKSHAHKKGKE